MYVFNYFIKFMANQSNKNINNTLTKLVNQPYKYGFSTKIEKDIIEKGLNENVIKLISEKKNEPDFYVKFRLKAYRKWKNMRTPDLGAFEISNNRLSRY